MCDAGMRDDMGATLVECDAAGIFFLTSRTRSEHTATPFQLLSLFVLSLILVKLVFPSVGSLEVHIERQCGVSLIWCYPGQLRPILCN